MKSYNSKYFGNSMDSRRKAKEEAEKEKKKKWYSNVYVGSPTLSEWVFPIYACQNDNGVITVRDIWGTCFHIGRDLFLTANHVVVPDDNYNHFQLGFLNQVQPGKVRRYDFTVVERFETSDLALLKCPDIFQPELKPKPFHWAHSTLKYYEIVRAMGYPKAYDPVNDFTISRAFQGTRIGTRQFKHDIIDANCHEVSFHCLRGLSGTCLLDTGYKIHGHIIGNSKDEAYIFHEKETIIVEGQPVIKQYITNETMYIGLAVTKNHIFQLQSNYLGTTFHEYFISEKIHECYC